MRKPSSRQFRQLLALAGGMLLILGLITVCIPEYRRSAALEAFLLQGGMRSGSLSDWNSQARLAVFCTEDRLPGWFRPPLPEPLKSNLFVAAREVRFSSVSSLRTLTDAERRCLELFPELRVIQLNVALSEDDYRRLSGLPCLTEISLRMEAGAAGFEQLRNRQRLRNIDLTCEQFENRDMQVLASCLNLERVSLNGHLQLQTIATLARLPRLMTLELRHVTIVKNSTSEILNPSLSGDDLRPLSAFAALRSLDLAYLETGALASLPTLPALKELTLHGDIGFLDLEELKRFPQLDSVRVESYWLSEECLQRHETDPAQFEGWHEEPKQTGRFIFRGHANRKVEVEF